MRQSQQFAVPGIIWLAALLGSALPGILCQEMFRIHDHRFPWPDRILVFQFTALLILTVCTVAFTPLRPVRDAVLMTAAFLLGWSILGPPIFDDPRRMHWAIEHFGIGWASLLDRCRLLVPAVLMTLVVVGRYRRQDLFWAWGKLSAPVRWSILFPFPVRTWSMMLAIGLVLAVALLGTLLAWTIGFNWTNAARLPPRLPAVLATSLLNAAGEEYIFRMLPLAVFIPAVGPRQAIALTAVTFGLGHWYGQPSGPFGVVLMTYAGWALAKSMVETEGAGWAFCLHTFGDVLIFSLLALAQP